MAPTDGSRSARRESVRREGARERRTGRDVSECTAVTGESSGGRGGRYSDKARADPRSDHPGGGPCLPAEAWVFAATRKKSEEVVHNNVATRSSDVSDGCRPVSVADRSLGSENWAIVVVVVVVSDVDDGGVARDKEGRRKVRGAERALTFTRHENTPAMECIGWIHAATTMHCRGSAIVLFGYAFRLRPPRFPLLRRC